MGRSGVSAQEAYDRLAPHYRAYACARAAYLDAVDRYVIEHAPKGASLLDVGAGDGVRAAAIARAIAASHVVLCEPSERMASLCRLRSVAQVWTQPAENLPVTSERFDVVTCLWNVLGHLPDRTARIRALAGMRRLLAPGGRIFCDVNNRHNARASGPLRVLGRRMLDAIYPDDRRGDAVFEWRIGDERIPGRGHLFTPGEMDSIVHEAGLRIEERIAVDYLSGAPSPRPWDGQLVYRLAAPFSETGISQ